MHSQSGGGEGRVGIISSAVVAVIRLTWPKPLEQKEILPSLME